MSHLSYLVTHDCLLNKINKWDLYQLAKQRKVKQNRFWVSTKITLLEKLIKLKNSKQKDRFIFTFLPLKVALILQELWKRLQKKSIFMREKSYFWNGLCTSETFSSLVFFFSIFWSFTFALLFLFKYLNFFFEWRRTFVKRRFEFFYLMKKIAI